MENKRYTKEQYNFLFAELKSQIKAAGLYAKCPRRAMAEFIIVLALFSLSLYSVEHFSPLVTAMLFATSIMRSTFVAHDLVHGQYFKSRDNNKRISYLFANVLMGISRSWWERKHNLLHHTFTNIVGKDEDIDASGGAFTGDFKYPYWYHRSQHIFFWPLLTLLYFVFWVQSITYVIKKKYWGELALLVLNGMMPIYIISIFGFWHGLLIVTTMYMLWSAWFGAVIITNHLGLEMFPEEEYSSFSWLELQNRTSRNVRGGRFTHWFYGGLNTQVEHHLYPRASRFYLPKAAKITEAFCEKHGIVYQSMSPWQSYKQIYHFLKANRPN